jgi:hypothetical protein
MADKSIWRVGSIDPREALQELLREAGVLIQATLKKLLEKKHLYQSVSLSEPEVVEHIKSSVPPSLQQDAIDGFLPRLSSDWFAASSDIVSVEGQLWFKAPDVKLFCKRCDRLEAFNSAGMRSFFQDCYDNSQTVQVFAFSFLCQACKSIPEVFIVRRVGLKLTLCGRAPIEHVDVPPVIPRSVQSFYRGALLAFQSGQALAGNFMLRTVIEQWARQATRLETATQDDKVVESYMALLPDDFKARFPSMKALYGDLSADIHLAAGSSDLFERARAEIVRHFEARKVFELA